MTPGGSRSGALTVCVLSLAALALAYFGTLGAEQIEFNGIASPRMGEEIRFQMPRFGSAVGMSATWYGSHYDGRKTASGEVFDSEALTAAHRTLPFGTRLRVEHAGRAVNVIVTDRGPFTEGRDLDLSAAAFRALAPLERGVIRVGVRREVHP